MCDSVVAVGPNTAAGVTLFAKNSDRKDGECQPLLQFPAALHARGATLRCTHVTIAQVAETYAVMGHSPWWVWGFEQGVNEHAVAIGNHTVFSNEPVEQRQGLIGMDLVRLGLERGRSAREALEVMAGLLEVHGQGGAALAPGASGYHNSFLLADPAEAWVLETSGRRWAARKVELEALSNHLCTAGEWQIGSRDLESFARGEGWWQSPGRVDFAAAYRNAQVPGRISEGRRRRARALLAAGRGKHDARTLALLLRDHGDGGVAPVADATSDEERYFTLCMHAEPVGTTTASLIAGLPREREAVWPVWVSFATPCVGVFLPVYIHGVIPPELAAGGDSFDPESAWWVFHRLQHAASANYARNVPLLREGWKELEGALESERSEVEAEARRRVEESDPDGAARQLSDFMERCVRRALERAAELERGLVG